MQTSESTLLAQKQIQNVVTLHTLFLSTLPYCVLFEHQEVIMGQTCINWFYEII